MKKFIITTLSLCFSFAANAVVVFSQPPDAAGGTIASSWLDPNGSDADMYAYDSFMLASNAPISEVHWCGSYLYGAPYGRVTGFSITFYESIAGGSQPHVNNPQLPEIYLAKYAVTNNAGETNADIVGGTQMYDYGFALPTPFQALAGVKYWVRIEGTQIGYPDWGVAAGTGGDGQHFGFSTGAARFFYSFGDEAFTLVAPQGPYFTAATSPSPAAGGWTSGDGLYTNNASVTVVATANPGYAFVNWTRNGTQVSTVASYTFTLTTNRTLVANFAPAFTITTSAAPGAGGTTTGDGSYTYGSSVPLTATANANYRFVNWTENGVPVSAARSYTFNAGASQALTANFVAANANISAVFSQPHNGSGTVNKSSWYDPNGLDGDEYAYENFTLSSNQPITKLRWRGGYTNYKSGAGKSPVYDFTISIYPSIPAGIQPDIVAGPLKTYNVGSNAGETYAGNFGGTDMYDYEFVLPTTFNAVAGTKYWVKLYASQGLTPFYYWPPDWGLATGTGGNGSHFDEITGGSLAGGTLYYTEATDLALTLYGPAAGDSINTIASPGYGGSASGGGVYTNGASVTVTATPAPGHVFVNWNDNGVPVSAATNYTFTATTNRTLVANFADPYLITTSVSPDGGGTTSGDGTYFGGTNVMLVATTNAGFTFVDWTESGFEVSTAARYYFIADANHALVANFARVYTIAANVSPTNGGFTTGGGIYLSGTSVALTPTPNVGYASVNWTENGVPVCNKPNYSFLADTNHALVANFATACAITTSSSSTNGATSGDGSFPAGASVLVTATPKSGFTFSNWTENGTPVSASAVYVFTATTNRALVANFAPAPAGITFDFDTASPALTNTQTTPFNQSSGALTAQFSATNGAAFSVQNDGSIGWMMSRFSGHYLFPNLAGSVLEISFSQPVSRISLNFATTDFQPIVTPSTVQLTAYQNSTTNAPVGMTTAQGVFNPSDTAPMGTVGFDAGNQWFNVVQVAVPSGLADLLVDDVSVVATNAVRPQLALRFTAGTNAAVSWPWPSTGCRLQQNSDLASTNWVNVTNAAYVAGTNCQLVLPKTGGSLFFRLVQP